MINNDLSQAVLLINTELGCEKDCIESLKDVTEIKEAYEVHGHYDIIMMLEAQNMQELKNLIRGRIKSNRFIRFSLTMIRA